MEHAIKLRDTYVYHKVYIQMYHRKSFNNVEWIINLDCIINIQAF